MMLATINFEESMWCQDCDEGEAREAVWECSHCCMEQPFRMCNSCSQRCRKRGHNLKKVVRTKIYKENVSQLERVAAIVRAQRAELAVQERETMKIYNRLVDAQEKLCHGAGSEGKQLMEQYFRKLRITVHSDVNNSDYDEKKESSCEENESSLPETFYNDARTTSKVVNAAIQGDLAELKKLRKLGANLFMADYTNRTALHEAASKGHYAVVEWLASEAEQVRQLYPRDRWNNTPIDDARRNGFIDIEMIFKRYVSELSAGDGQESVLPEDSFFTQKQKRALDAYLRKETIEIMVLGEVNSGKSTFINALLQVTSMCPMNQLACTSALTRLTYDEERRCRLVHFARKKPTMTKSKIGITHWIDTPNYSTLSSLIAHRDENTKSHRSSKKRSSGVQDDHSFVFNFTNSGRHWYERCLERQEKRLQMRTDSSVTREYSDVKEDILDQSEQESEELSNRSNSSDRLWSMYQCSPSLKDLVEDDKKQMYLFSSNKEATQTLLDSSTFEDFQYVVELTCPSMMLKHGLEIIDSPGMNESQMLTASVEKMIEEVDGVIYILDGNRGTITEKDKQALQFLKESMSKMNTSFDCAFVVNRIDIWEETETVEENLDAIYQKLRDFMVKPYGRSIHQKDIREKVNQMFPKDRVDCDVFHGLSAKRAYGDGDFKVRQRPKRFIEFERIFSTKLRERLEIRMLEAVSALVRSINFCYTVFVNAESTNLLLDTLQWCSKLSKELQENVFPELKRYINESETEYAEYVSKMISQKKGQWISKCSKSTEDFSDIYTVGKRKDMVGRKLMAYICKAFTGNTMFQTLIENTRSRLKSLTTELLEKNFIRPVQKCGDSRMVFFQALEGVCFDSFHGHNVELFTAARSTFSKMKFGGKKWYHRMRTGLKTEEDVMKWFLDGKGFSKKTFVKYLLQPFRDAISLAEKDCKDVWEHYKKLSTLVEEFQKKNIKLSHVKDQMAHICAKTLEIGQSIIAVTKENRDGDEKDGENIQQPKDFQNEIIEQLILECQTNIDRMMTITKEVQKSQSWYLMTFEQPWKLSAFFEDLDYDRVEGEGQTQKIKEQRTYLLAPLKMSPGNSVLNKFTMLVRDMFCDYSEGLKFSRAELVRNEFLEQTFLNQVMIFQHRRSEKATFRNSGTIVEPCMTGTQEWDKQKFLGQLKHKFLPKTDRNLKSFEILLMWHGTTEDEVKENSKVHNILQCGLADYAKQDQGWFGRGVYCTSNSGYAARYSMEGSQPNSKGEYVMLLCTVVVGNVYIITRETDYRFRRSDGRIEDKQFCRYDYRYPDGNKKEGIALRAGYDAHYACLSEELGNQVPPCDKADNTDYDELVVRSETQILPICKVYFQPGNRF